MGKWHGRVHRRLAAWREALAIPTKASDLENDTDTDGDTLADALENMQNRVTALESAVSTLEAAKE